MLKLFKKRGSLTVEASMVLPIVLITMFFFINLINVYLAHTCMQQALNNTAKKITRNAYFVYKFSGEEQYLEFINNINNETFEDASLITKANNVIQGYNSIEGNFSNTTDSLSSFFESIKNIPFSKLLSNFGEFWDSCMLVKDNAIKTLNQIVETQKSTKKLIKDLGDLGKKNSKYIILQTLYDEINSKSTSMFLTQLFFKYTSDLQVSIKKIENIKISSSRINDNSNGTFKLYLTYKFKNPFSMLNNSSLEYSLVNREIRMFHTVDVCPFVGKSKTSLKELYDIKAEREPNGGGEGGGVR